MRFKTLVLSLTLGLLVGVGACRPNSRSGSGTAATPRNAATTLQVVNQRFLDMDIYVLPQNGPRLRLGTATGNSTTNMRIPASVIFGTTQLQFVANPIGGAGASLSQSILVVPGDQVTLTITP